LKILNIVGARPNFMKVAPLHQAFARYPNVLSKIVHTGQHTDPVMSDVFFDQLHLPKPDYSLCIGSRSTSGQTAEILGRLEILLRTERPDLVVVVGDVTSTLACALGAVQNGIPVAHVEAGLRSFDRTMPEEINRVLVDQLSDYLFVTEQSAVQNLMRERIAEEKIHFVGNVLIDTLIKNREKATQYDLPTSMGLRKGAYVLVTLHRPSNVDTREDLEKGIEIIRKLGELTPVVFSVHPRTERNLERYGLEKSLKQVSNLYLLPPQGYLPFLNLVMNATLVVTDSGGIQEETTFLNIPCFTLRKSTERPVTTELGSNRLFPDFCWEALEEPVRNVVADGYTRKGAIPPLWDGRAAERIAQIIVTQMGS
jgi:UDP-N-acetylglucosamine 2-epimerase (non-hydrolysing)